MGNLESLRHLLRHSHHARPDDLPQMAMQAAPLPKPTAIIVYLVDHQQRLLTPLLAGTAPHRDPFAVDGTLAGRAFTLLAPSVSDTEIDRVRLWLPLINGAERMGIVEFVLDAPPWTTAPRSRR